MADYNFLQKFIEDKNPTPSYVFDLDALAVHVNKIKELLAGKARVCYAMKANPFLTRPMMKHVDLSKYALLENFAFVSVSLFQWKRSCFQVYIKILLIFDMYLKHTVEREYIQ